MPRQRTDTQAADVIADAGRALYGEHWRAALSAAIGVREDTIRMWMSGRMAVPAGVTEKVGALVEQRIEELEGVAEKIETLRRAGGERG